MAMAMRAIRAMPGKSSIAEEENGNVCYICRLWCDGCLRWIWRLGMRWGR